MPEPSVQTPQVEVHPPDNRPAPPGSVAWIKAVLPKLRETAIDNPTDENIQAYYYAQRLMMDKSEQFSRRSMEVIRNDPLLDEDLRYPASNAASDALAGNAGKQKEHLLKTVAENAGIIFFFKGQNCPLCEQSIAALNALEHRYGFSVIPVSLDGKPLPNGAYPEFRTDAGLAKRLGIISAPAMALAVPPKGSYIISYSTVSSETASVRILSAAHKANLISDDEYKSTSRLASIGLINGKALEELTPELSEDPATLVQYLKGAAHRAYLGEQGVRP